MGLNLITGPANAGKVALLLHRYLEALPREPYLIVPNRSDVEERERELLAIQPALLGGSIGTFDDLFKRLARGGSESRHVATEAQRALIVRRALAGQSLNGLGRSGRRGGRAEWRVGRAQRARRPTGSARSDTAPEGAPPGIGAAGAPPSRHWPGR